MNKCQKKKAPKKSEGFIMIIYWKSASNQMMNEESFLSAQVHAKEKISQWAKNELHLQNQLLDEFVSTKVEEYSRSFIKVSLPFESEAFCYEYLQKFYDDNVEIISLFPYDRWAWIQKLENIHYGEYDIQSVHVESKLLDHKELPLI